MMILSTSFPPPPDALLLYQRITCTTCIARIGRSIIYLRRRRPDDVVVGHVQEGGGEVDKRAGAMELSVRRLALAALVHGGQPGYSSMYVTSHRGKKNKEQKYHTQSEQSSERVKYEEGSERGGGRRRLDNTWEMPWGVYTAVFGTRWA